MAAELLAMPDFGEDVFAGLSIRSAVDEGLAIPELLERIILNLDMRTILTKAQRLSQAWKLLIDSSTSIQQKLYFKPIIPKSVQDITDNRTKNPLLEQIFRPWFEERANYTRESPFQFLTEEPPRRHLHHQWTTTKKDAFLRKGASWRRMLVQQPACPKIGVIQKTKAWMQNMGFASAVLEYPTGTCIRDAISKNDSGGVRMGAMYDLVYRMMAHPKHKCGMRVLWRVPRAEPQELEKYYYACGEHEVVINWRYTDDIVIVILQEGRTPGLAPGLGEPNRPWYEVGMGAPDNSVWESDPNSFQRQFRSEDFVEVQVPLKVEFTQDQMAGYGY